MSPCRSLPSWHLVWPAAFVAVLSAGSPAGAAMVYVTKDCSANPCTYMGNSAVLGRFKLSGSSFNWQAMYQGAVKNFWVSQGGINMADNKLNGAPGDLSGSASLTTGVFWFIGVKTALMGDGTYTVYGSTVLGDPHIATTNGMHYDFQGGGEFVLLKKGTAFEVQSRMTPVSTERPGGPEPRTELSTCVSVNTAAALKTERHRVTYQPSLSGRVDPAGMQLRVDGRLVKRVPSRGLKLDDGTTIVKDAQTGIVRVDYPDETSVKVVPTWWAGPKLWYLDFDMSPPDDAVGVAGAIGAQEWLPALPDGTSAGPKPGDTDERYKALYGRFADAWRATDATTLFDYGRGKSTADFTVPDWPRRDGRCEVPGMTPLKGTTIETARQICSRIVVPHMQRACLQDAMATGDKVFGKSYAKTQGPVLSKDKGPYGTEQ